jgi:hypothetical protein
MKEPFDIGGPLKLEPKFSIGSPQAGLRPRSETPNIGGPLKILSEFEMEVLRAERRTLGSTFEGGTAISVKTDVL